MIRLCGITHVEKTFFCFALRRLWEALGRFEKSELFTFPENYSELIESLSQKVDAKVNDKSQHYRDPSANGYDIAIQIKEIWDLPELNQIADHILPCLEQTVFGSYVHCSAIHIYRNIFL